MVRNTVIVLLTCVILVATTHVSGRPDKAEDPTAGAEFVGEKSCKKCHFKEHKSWKKMKHAAAWTVMEGKLTSPDQKDDMGKLCISCHVTGYGKADRGGFKSIEESQHLLGVQCEACHGPGSKHVEAATALKAAKRKKFEADESSFIVRRTAACADCHNPHHAHASMK